MPTSLRLFLPAVALAFPLLSAAQTPAAPPAVGLMGPRPGFYLGLAAASGSAASPDGFSGTPTTSTTRNQIPVLPKFTLGWQFSPRLAVQVSGLYAQQNDTYRFEQANFDAAGQFTGSTPGSYNFRFHSVVVPVLARYTVAGLGHRLQFDGLGGATLVHRFTQYHNEVNIPAPDPSQPPITTLDYDRSSLSAHVSLGAGLRYRLGSRLEATGDVLANYLLNSANATSNGYIHNTGTTRMTFTSALGLLYRFGSN